VRERLYQLLHIKVFIEVFDSKEFRFEYQSSVREEEEAAGARRGSLKR